jgi:hypothetical protein
VSFLRESSHFPEQPQLLFAIWSEFNVMQDDGPGTGFIWKFLDQPSTSFENLCPIFLPALRLEWLDLSNKSLVDQLVRGVLGFSRTLKREQGHSRKTILSALLV